MGRLIALLATIALAFVLAAPAAQAGGAKSLPPPDELLRPAPATTHYAKVALILRSPVRSVTNAGRIAPGVVSLRYSYQPPAQGAQYQRIPVGEQLADIELFITEQNGV